MEPMISGFVMAWLLRYAHNLRQLVIFIAGDVHFTELGHRLLFDEVRRAESLSNPDVHLTRHPGTEAAP
jgi:hypothetical protein